MKTALELVNVLSQKMAALDEDIAEVFVSELQYIAMNARFPHGHGEVYARAFVIDLIQRSLPGLQEFGDGRNNSQRFAAQVEQCTEAATRTAGANVALTGAFDALVKLLSHIFDLPVIERVFLASRIESMGDVIRHNNGLGDNDSIDLLAWWNRFHANSYAEFAYHLLSWCYENDTHHKVSDICGWMFGYLPVNDNVRQILKKGMADPHKCERIRDYFGWMYFRQFKD